MWTYNGVKVHWLGHDSFVLEGSKTLVIDPFKASGRYRADILLISHEHFDHLSEEDIGRFSGPTTTIVAPSICQEPLKKFTMEKRFVSPGSSTEVEGVRIEAVPAYNTNKFASPGNFFHSKAEARVGYVMTLDRTRFYHAGDSDATPEMRSLDVDVAFLPVSGTYVMTAEEAAEAAKAMKAKVVIPMHIGSIVGSLEDAERFKRLVAAAREVVILQKE